MYYTDHLLCGHDNVAEWHLQTEDSRGTLNGDRRPWQILSQFNTNTSIPNVHFSQCNLGPVSGYKSDTKGTILEVQIYSGSDTWELWSLRSISVSVTFNIMCIWSIPAGDGKRRFSRKYHITQYLKFMNLAVTRMCFLLICRGARPQSKNIVIFMIYFRCSMSTLIFLHCTVWAYVKRVLHVRKGPLTISSHRARTPSYQL